MAPPSRGNRICAAVTPSCNGQRTQTTLSSVCLPVSHTATRPVLGLHPAGSDGVTYKRTCTVRWHVPARSALCILAPLSCSPSFLHPVSLQHPHAPSLTRLRVCSPPHPVLKGYLEQNISFRGLFWLSTATWEAVHNGSVALPSVTLSSLSKVRLVSRVHHHSPH